MHDDASLIPPIGSVPQAERMFRVNWVASLTRSWDGAPQVSPDFVARQGRRVRLIDLRDDEALLGPLGYIPGVDWVPAARALTLAGRVSPDDPVVLISHAGGQASQLALQLARQGLRFVAAMAGGMVAWRDLGFVTSRDPAILGRLDRLRPPAAAAERAPGALKLSEIEAHVGDPATIRWLKAAALLIHGRVSCVDGRDDSGVVGTPGGDGGEFLLGLAALEQVTGRALDERTIDGLIRRRVDAFGRFYMHTDVASANRFIASMRSDRRLDEALSGVFEALEWRRFLSSPPPAVRDIVLEHMLLPGHLGCGHIKMMMTRADDYGVRPGLVAAFLSSFLRARWGGAPELELVPLPGGHAEGAVLNVRVAGEFQAFSRIPLVSPSAAGSQTFVNHPQVASFLRHQLAHFLIQQDDLVPVGEGSAEPLRRAMEALAARQMGHTLGALAAGLPVYELFFRGERVSVRLEGHVPAP